MTPNPSKTVIRIQSCYVFQLLHCTSTAKSHHQRSRQRITPTPIKDHKSTDLQKHIRPTPTRTERRKRKPIKAHRLECPRQVCVLSRSTGCCTCRPLLSVTTQLEGRIRSPWQTRQRFRPGTTNAVSSGVLHPSSSILYIPSSVEPPPGSPRSSMVSSSGKTPESFSRRRIFLS